jgi:ABC-2 type transport system permease protein
MSRVLWAVIKREYLQRVRSRWFVAATIGAPLLMIGLIAAPIILAERSQGRERALAVLDGTGRLFTGLSARLEPGGYELTEATPGPEAEESLREQVSAGSLGGYLVLGPETLSRGEVRYMGREGLSPVRSAIIRQAVVQTALEVRLGGDSRDVDALLSGGDLEVEVLAGGGGGARDPTFIAAYMGAFLLYMVVLFYAVAVMRSVLEEKTSRIVEVVISSMKPFHLMLGKILGVGAVGLTQIAIWIGLVTVFALTGLPALVTAQPEIFTPDFVSEVIPGAGYALLMLVFFLGGYFIYSGIYAAVGAMCSSDEEAQQAQFPVVLLLVVPIIFVSQVIQDPTSTTAVVLSFIPFFTPILMFARAAAGGATAPEIAGSVLLMSLTVVAVAWVAGRVYRVGILMAGKRPTLPEIIRWVREA